MIFTPQDYLTEHLSATVDTRHYMENYRDTARFEALCRECRAYGHRWGCPPHDCDWAARLRSFPHVFIAGTKITPHAHDIPADEAFSLLEPETKKLNNLLLAKEAETRGLAFGFAGKCPYCPGMKCTRTEGKPCRHPELVRPSLESVGFDVAATARDLLGVELAWGRDGMLPPYLVIVGAVFL